MSLLMVGSWTNGHHFADNIFKSVWWSKFAYFNSNSLKLFFHASPTDNMSNTRSCNALVTNRWQVNTLTNDDKVHWHLCVMGPQWVNWYRFPVIWKEIFTEKLIWWSYFLDNGSHNSDEILIMRVVGAKLWQKDKRKTRAYPLDASFIREII